MMENLQTGQSFPWRLFFAELIGTALLLLFGLSFVIFMFGAGSPMEDLIPTIFLRRIITGFLFGSIGALISISHIGKISGAHINPVVTLAFWLFHKIENKVAAIYVMAQLIGAVVGCLPLLIWDGLGRSISFGATWPGDGYTTQTVIMGEVITTFALVTLLTIFIGFRNLRPYTPAISPFLYAIMVPLEASISGTSTNPARSFGPSLILGEWTGWWIYWVGPIIGATLACLFCSRLAKRITTAKLYHFDSDSDGLLRTMAEAGIAEESKEG